MDFGSNVTVDNDTSIADNAAFFKVVEITVPIFFGIIILTGLFGNLLVVIVVAANKQMRSTTNILIFNLAVADLLFIVFCVPFTATDYVLAFWPYGQVWCQIVQYLIVVTAYASVYTLVLMSLDRYLAVVHPVASMSVRTEKNAISATLIVWMLILLSCVPVFFSHGLEELGEENVLPAVGNNISGRVAVRNDSHFVIGGNISYGLTLLDRWNLTTGNSTGNSSDGFIESKESLSACHFLDKSFNKVAYQVSFFLTSYLIPLMLICGLYLFMLLRLWRNSAPGGKVSEESRRGRKRVTRLVVVIVGIFALSWFPIQVILVIRSIYVDAPAHWLVALQIVSQVLAYSNSCVNPILYAFLSENFRKAFRKVIYFKPSPESVGGGKARMSVQKYGREKNTTTTKTSKINGDIL